ncbi:MAG TPA: universal stress protein [Candidatus Binataceae bacterium]|jgi:nucleotide-binding universal stress UspA family protein|nr:universal stress protein [Candidatus Binataceae bacterium]
MADNLFHKILCPVDFDENSMAALELAVKVAAQNDAPLCLMHVVPFPLAASEIGPLPTESQPVWERGAQARLEEIAREKVPATLRCEVVVRSGQPVEVIVGAETELGVDLVVMATHGRSRSAVGHFFLGSVAERVVRESLCPVLVVPPR